MCIVGLGRRSRSLFRPTYKCLQLADKASRAVALLTEQMGEPLGLPTFAI
jgi:hypothetical protein